MRHWTIGLMLALAVAPATAGRDHAAEASTAAAGIGTPPAGTEAAIPEVVRALIDAEPDPQVRAVLVDVATRHPRLVAARARARAAAERPAKARSLPDPQLATSLFLVPPETRVGPQRLTLGLSQAVPWRGKLAARGRAAARAAERAAREADRLALDLVTRARSLLVRIGYLDRAIGIVDEDLATLQGFEALARARYAAGIGLAQAAVKVQAEITRDRTRRLALEQERAALVAELNALRDRPGTSAVPATAEPVVRALAADPAKLRAQALSRLPEVAAADAGVAEAGERLRLARLEYRPDFRFGLGWTFVDRRQDAAGRLVPPEDNGQDALALTFGLTIPLWRERLAAGVREAGAVRAARGERRRDVVLEIDRRLDDLLARVPLVRDQWRLFRDVLTPQAEESLNSARAAYETGRLEMLDLLDAERVLLEVRLGAIRAATDWRLLVIELERTVARPLTGEEEVGS
ncbi:MAG: TolC family protein [Acidobacteria bacterium]|nr:MAG: TolC family protein [Acidobacteriota bacterium]